MTSWIRQVFSLSSLATLLTCIYLYASLRGLYYLMNPLALVPAEEVSLLPPHELITPFWDDLGVSQSQKGTLKVYMSSESEFSNEMLVDEYLAKGDEALTESVGTRHRAPGSILLWESSEFDPVASLSLRKSILLREADASADTISPSYSQAEAFLSKQQIDEQMEELEGGGSILSLLSSHAGEGIESTSVLLHIYASVSNFLSTLMGKQNASSPKHSKVQVDPPNTINVPPNLWSQLINSSSPLQTKSTYIHVILSRHQGSANAEDTYAQALKDTRVQFARHEAILGGTQMVKYDIPHHIQPPKRKIYRDLVYIFTKPFSSSNNSPPWDMSHWKPTEYDNYQLFLEMKQNNKPDYPYWKPSVAIKLVKDGDSYPTTLADKLGMPIFKKRNGHYAYLPALHVDEIGLTSDKYVPLNSTIHALPLYLSMDTSSAKKDEENPKALTSSRWRLLSHLSQALESQKELGIEQTDIDDIRRLIAETNITLLTLTILASTLHLLFEFLTFKNEVEFWKGNTDLTGLSVRALFMDFFSQTIIVLYLIEKDSSLLMTVPSAFGCLIALWKCQRGAGFRIVKIPSNTTQIGEKVNFWNKIFRLIGYELQATRLRAAAKQKEDKNLGKKSDEKDSSKDLSALSEEVDRIATRTLGKYFLLPLVSAYVLYTLLLEEHTGWYSWLITSASSAVYALGFVLMTPQLFLNYKLKSVAHLPWRVLCYRFLNTFIDDLFAFIIRMPTMARISCFRDDIIFIIYLWQRYLYPVDTSRPVEGGGMDAISAAATTAKLSKSEEEIEKKQK